MGPGGGRAGRLVGAVAAAGLLLLLLVVPGLPLPAPPLPSSPAPGALLLVVLVLVSAAAVGGARLALRPLRLLRLPDTVGYLPQAGWSGAQAARRARKSRRLGRPLPPVFPNGWFCLLESARLAPGEARSLAALGEQFAVFRDWDGRAHVVDAYCPHLGANLAVGGRVVGSCIECPFHGWQFHGEDGRCTRIPYAEKVPTFAKIKVWPSCEVSGMILVWYHCDGVGPTWQVPEQEEMLSHKWVFRGITEHYVSAHIEEIPENAADVAHLAFVHGPSVLSGVDLRYSNTQLWAFCRHHWQAEWQPEPEPEAHCSRLLVKHHVTVFGKRFSLMDLVVRIRQVGPALVFIVFEHPFLGRGVIIQSVTPVEPLLQQVVHRIYYQRNIPAFIPKFIMWAERVQFERDIMIWNNKQFLSKPLLVKEDGPIQRHRRWYAQFYSKDSVKLTSPKASLDW